MDPGTPAPKPQLHTTLIRTEPTPASSGRRSSTWSLPADVLGESVRRVRVLAWLYALAYFLVGMLPGLFMAEDRARLFASPGTWAPPVVSIAGGVAVALLVSLPRIPARLKLRIGLAFEVLASAGIALAEYREMASPVLVTKELLPDGFGLSWVAPGCSCSA